jgi:hypothetical protein
VWGDSVVEAASVRIHAAANINVTNLEYHVTDCAEGTMVI